MKTITLLCLIFLFGCVQPTNNKQDKHHETSTQDGLRNKDSMTTNSIGQKFADFYFTIDCPCDLKKESNYIDNTSTFYKCADIKNKTFYRVTIDNQTDALRQLNLQEFDNNFINDFLNEYKANLKREKSEYIETTFNGQKAIIYKQSITVDAIPIKSKSIIFLAHKNSYTISIMSNPQMVDKYFETFIKSFKWTVQPTTIKNTQTQTQPKTNAYKSLKYGYIINIPKGFRKANATGKNIDFKLINDIGNSILVNVTPRQPQEYSITAHDYSVKMLESSIKPYNPYFSIVKSEKTYIDDEKAF